MGHEKETINEMNEQWEGRLRNYWEITKYRVYLLTRLIDVSFYFYLLNV